jgi:putative phosphonate catabolism associated alcohol dehydrogenase
VTGNSPDNLTDQSPTADGSSAAPQLARAAVFTGSDQPLTIETFRIPSLAPDEALVSIDCCTICGSDLHTIRGARTEPTPSILGHEAIGRIQAVGSPPPADHLGRPLAVGQRVTWSVIVSCGQCNRCRDQLPQKCLKLAKYGHERALGRLALSGGLSDHIVLRSGSVIVPVSDSLPAEVVCPANCATATVASAFRHAPDPAGRHVLILGAGMLGLTAAAWANAHHADTVVICDRNPERLRLAARFGAQHTITWESGRKALQTELLSACGTSEFDIVLELAGNLRTVEAALACAGIGGRIILAGTVLKTPAVGVDPERIVRRCQTIVGVHNYAGQDLVTAVNFLEEHAERFPFAQLCERRFALDDVHDAVDYAMAKQPVRVAVMPAGLH